VLSEIQTQSEKRKNKMELANFSNLTTRIANKASTNNKPAAHHDKTQGDSNFFLDKDSESIANFENFFKGIEFLTNNEKAVINEPDLKFSSNEPNFSVADTYLEIDETKVPKFTSFLA